ncbi:hypothetical protein VKT23_020624 [Stygiomarasmius scandens]|uniref:Ribonuclease H1 N-terminal domain-containing protein n=1 Tax=Marasmiellus scandens TaxID=2682957 RepID=A0ABR1IMH9_9AGAR
MSIVTPRKGRFAWTDIDINDAAFRADCRQGCTPALFETATVSSVSQTNYRFYLVLTGNAPGIYYHWGFLKSTIDLDNDVYKGFNNKAELLAFYRWYCLHYHHHRHDSEYDSFVNPLESPFQPSLQLRQQPETRLAALPPPLRRPR